jgi:hypothetical protein
MKLTFSGSNIESLNGEKKLQSTILKHNIILNDEIKKSLSYWMVELKEKINKNIIIINNILWV